MNNSLHRVSRVEAVGLERQRARLRWKDSMRSNITQAMKKCGVPEKFSAAEESSISAGIWQTANCVADGQGLFIFGASGVGKTYLAALCLKMFLLSMEPVFREDMGTVPQDVGFPMFSTVPDMLLAVRDTFKQRDLSENDVLKRYSVTPLLVLDDLGGEKITEGSATTLYTIINRRYAGKQPLVITSSMNLKELEDGYNAASAKTGSAIAIRITETSKILSLQAARKTMARGRKRRQR